MSALKSSLIFAAVLLSASGTARAFSPRCEEPPATKTLRPIESTVWGLLSPPASAPKPVADEIAQHIARLGRDAIAPAVGILLGTLLEPETDVAVHPDIAPQREMNG